MDYTGPPITYADHQRESFSWCQVVYLYASELVKAGAPEVRALEEALMVKDAMEAWGSPTPLLGAPSHHRSELVVHWPTLICAANAYASLPPNRRLEVIEMLERGTPASELPAGYGTGGCDRKVLDDTEYHPAPPCVPQKTAGTALAAIAAFGVTSLVAWLVLR